MRTRVGKESAQLGGDEQTREDGLYSGDRGGGYVSGYTTDARAETRGTTSSQHDNGDGTVQEKTWFEPVGITLECKDGVCPVPWAIKEETPVVQPDEVNHPPHYTDGGIECIEAIEASLTPEEFRGYCKGNLMKYGWRERLKGGTKSLKKAQWYLDRLIQFDECQKG
jgi:hypothetical protein